VAADNDTVAARLRATLAVRQRQRDNKEGTFGMVIRGSFLTVSA
jgi:hypothetical protein